MKFWRADPKLPYQRGRPCLSASRAVSPNYYCRSSGPLGWAPGPVSIFFVAATGKLMPAESENLVPKIM
jgi:hypothetical protein